MIRLGTLNDIEAIRKFDEFSNFRLAEVGEGRMHIFEYSGEVVGYISLAAHRLHGHPFIEFLCIMASHRRKGIGAALVGHVESLFPGKRVFGSTEDWNAPMRALLLKAGYVLSGSLLGVNQNGEAEVYFYRDVEGKG